MNTFKIKVLLILTNDYLLKCIGRSLLIWIATCTGGCLILYGLNFLTFPPIESLILSLVFSSPALLIAVPFLYRLPEFQTAFIRSLLSVGIILLTSAGVTAIVSVFFKLRYSDVAECLFWFVPSALISFFLIMRKQLTKSYPV